jgi:hypothetical protein
VTNFVAVSASGAFLACFLGVNCAVETGGKTHTPHKNVRQAIGIAYLYTEDA